MATMLLQSPAAIKQQFQAWDQQLSARGAAPTVAREVAQSARAQRFDGANLAPTLTYWSEMLRVATTRGAQLKRHLDAGAVLGGVDSSTRGALGLVRGKLAGGSPAAEATRAARVVLFLVKQYAGLCAILGGAPPDARTAAFAATLCAVHQVLETTPPSEARAGARAALGGELDGALLRVAVAHGPPFVACLAGRPNDGVAAGRGACLARLMATHGSAVAELHGDGTFAGVILRAALQGALATPRPDFGRLVEGPVVALRLAMRKHARDAVDALLAAAMAEDPRARELAGLVWAAFLAGCEPRLRLALLERLAASGGNEVVLERAVLGGWDPL